MGFAKGFAEAFSQSYGQATAIKARKEESEYEWRMKGLFDEKEKRAELETKTKRAQAVAKRISETTGAPLKEVYQRALDGDDPNDLMKWAENGNWSGVKYNAGSLDLSSIPDPQTIDDEMEGSGLAAAESPVNPTTTSAREPGEWDGVYRAKPKVMKPSEQRDSLIQEYGLSSTSNERRLEIEGILEREGEAERLVNPREGRVGRTKQDLIADGVTPFEGVAFIDGKPVQKLLKMTPEGQYLDANTDEPVERARQVTEPEQASLDKIYGSADSQAVVEQRSKLQGAVDSLRIGNDVIKMSQNDPRLTSSFTGSVAATVSTLRREAGTALSLLDDAVKAKKGIDPELIKQAEDEVNSIDLSALDVVDKFAAEQGLYEAKKNILVFKVAQALGQTGNAFSDTDFKRIENGLFAGKGKDIQRSIGDYLRTTIKDVNSGASIINQFNTANNEHERRYGYRPIEGDIATTVEDFVATQDPQAQEGLALILSGASTQGSGTPNDPVRTDPNQPKTTKSGVSWRIK